jgi:hypothetical protein
MRCLRDSLFVRLQKEARAALRDGPFVRFKGGKHGTGYGVLGGFLNHSAGWHQRRSFSALFSPLLKIAQSPYLVKPLSYESAQKKEKSKTAPPSDKGFFPALPLFSITKASA